MPRREERCRGPSRRSLLPTTDVDDTLVAKNVASADVLDVGNIEFPGIAREETNARPLVRTGQHEHKTAHFSRIAIFSAARG